MERLTERTKYGIVGNNAKVSNYPLYKVANSDPLDHNIIEQCFEKLAEYEDLEEQGLLLRLPCKVGDTIYHIWNVDDKQEIQEIKIATLNNLVAHMEYGNFGKTIFLTQAEAEQKLKEMESD